MKATELVKDQDCERWQALYNQFRGKYLALQRDIQLSQDTWAKEREEYKAMIDELRVGAQLQAEPRELKEKQTRDWMREKNDELVDTLVKQERMCEKYKWELKKTGEALESETSRVDKLRKENLHLRNYIKSHVKVPSAAELDEQHQKLRKTLLA